MPAHYSRIFLLSHMRAYTTLAGHILGSHPLINGYFEMHISYDDASAPDKQMEVLLQYERLKENSRYLFDKLLHNAYRLNSALFNPENTKILVSLLEPDKAVRSIMDLFLKKGTDHPYASPEAATAYYMERVETLADFCMTTNLPYYYYDAQLFKEAPEKLLARLTAWLELDSPLTERYQLFSQTGMPRKGDSSKLIRSGKIDRTTADYSHIQVPEHALTGAREAYRNCRSAIIEKAIDSVVKA